MKKNHVLTVVSIVVVIVFMSVITSLLHDKNALKENNKMLQFEVDTLKTDTIQLKENIDILSLKLVEKKEYYESIIDKYESRINEVMDEMTYYKSFKVIDDFSEEIIISKGYTVDLIGKDLMQHSDLIELFVALPWQMTFTEVDVLNHQMAIGTFEGGHTVGYGLYTFEIKEGVVQWRVIYESMID